MSSIKISDVKMNCQNKKLYLTEKKKKSFAMNCRYNFFYIFGLIIYTLIKKYETRVAE